MVQKITTKKEWILTAIGFGFSVCSFAMFFWPSSTSNHNQNFFRPINITTSILRPVIRYCPLAYLKNWWHVTPAHSFVFLLMIYVFSFCFAQSEKNKYWNKLRSCITHRAYKTITVTNFLSIFLVRRYCQLKFCVAA